MSKRMKIGSWMVVAGCASFFIYGICAALLAETVAAYEHRAVGGAELAALAEGSAGLITDSVMLIGLMGAGLSLCSGVLFWLGLFRGHRLAFLAGLVGGALGLTGLITVHFDQRAWILFIVDNVCLNLIGLGFAVAGKELRDFILGRTGPG